MTPACDRPAGSDSRPDHLADLVRDHERPPIVLVPGLDGTALLFYRQQPSLAREFDVVAFPLPDDPECSMADLVEDLHGIVREVSDRGAILIGESFGGALSVSTALAYPDAIRGLVIVNSFPWLSSRWQIGLAPYLLRLVPWAAMPIVRSLTESRLRSRNTLPEDLAQFHQRSRSIGREGYIRRLEILRHYDVREELGSLTMPTLYLAADEDRLVPSEKWGRFMAARTPNAELAVLQGYGHLCLIDHDLDLLDFVGPWWSRVSVP